MDKTIKETIHAKGIEIGIYTTDFENEFISLTDIAKYRNDDDPRFVIQNWMRNRNTIEFLGVWETLHNPSFNRVQFDTVKNEAGANRFVMTPTKWIELTNAIGIVSKSGRYGGGTFAHSDIAMSFASWLSPEFQLYIMKDYRRLKSDENSRLSLNWNLNRELSKLNYKIHTDSIKENLIIPELTPAQKSFVYADEADLLNVALFGQTAKEWRKDNPGKRGNIRDYADLHHLLVLANLESYNAILIEQNIEQPQRMEMLRETAIKQLHTIQGLDFSSQKILTISDTIEKINEWDFEKSEKMKILLVSVNASYMHTNLAIRDLKNYVEARCGDMSRYMGRAEIQIAEYTINQPIGEVLRGIASFNADWILFSTYIWNAEYVCKLLPEIKKILPDCVLGAGGPEFGYGAKKYLGNILALDFIMFGEGEETFLEMISKSGGEPKALLSQLADIKGIYYRAGEHAGAGCEISFTGNRDLIHNLDDIPFPYPEIVAGTADPDHKIYYYESSRGCPFSCSYCLSSVDKRVRFKSLERTCSELQIFLDNNIKLVKFVDRTYNLDENHYIGIWDYIMKHHNGKTMFHFEIEAEYLSDKALEFLQQIPDGMMQFEMGVQSANKKTLAAINRSTNIEALAEKIKRIPRTIHQHLDLIAGLPYEDLESFGHSYDFVMALRPDALQLGFLKIFGGTQMESYAKENGWKWMESPAYETFSTPYLSFGDIAFLKDMEIVTDAYWNKGSFEYTMNYVFRMVSPWKFLSALLDYGRGVGAFEQARREAYWFELINDFVMKESFSEFDGVFDKNLIYDLLRYDFVRAGKKGNFPAWYKHNYDKDKHRKLLETNGLLENSRIGFSITEYEEFEYNVLSEKPESDKEHTELLIRYK